jgi:hypothetical protein
VPTDPFKDRRFTITAAVIAAAYALLVFGIGALLGGSAATAAGLALAAFAAALFKRYESLRFPTLESAPFTVINLPPVGSPYILALTFALIGIQVVTGFVHGLVVSYFGITSEQSVWLPSLIATAVVAYAAGGFLAGKTAPVPRYSYAVIGTTLTVCFDSLLLLFQALVVGQRINAQASALMLLLCPIATVVGARWGLAPRFVQEEMDPPGAGMFPSPPL